MFGKNKIYSQSDFINNDKLLIKGIFHTIQGEATFSGWPATFIRLGLCNMKCHFCDTDFETDLLHLTVDEVINKVKEITPDHTKLIVITGGEPFLQPLLAELCIRFLEDHYSVQIETAGTLWLDNMPTNHPNFHIICSPKTGKLNPKLEQWISAYKYIIKDGYYSEEDGLPIMSTQIENKALKLARPLNRGIPIYIAPMDEYDESTNISNILAVKKIALQYGYRVSLQTHKILGVE